MLSQLLYLGPTKYDAASFGGIRFEMAAKTGCNWNDGTSESTPPSGNSGNWLLNSRLVLPSTA